jgi:hypothetical protein
VNDLTGVKVHWNELSVRWHHFGAGAVTLSMTPRPGRAPLIGVVPATKHDGYFVDLPVTDRYGHTIVLVLNPDCGYQPYFGSIALLPPALQELVAA